MKNLFTRSIAMMSLVLLITSLFSNYSYALSLTPETNFILSPIKSAEQTIGHYVDQITPGTQRKYTFYATNISKKTITLKSYPADVLPDENGGKGFSLSNKKPAAMGTWLSPQGVQEFKLKPKEKKQISFVVNVPKDLEPGQYIAVAAVEESTLAESQSISNDAKEAKLAADIDNRRGVQMIMEYQKDKSHHEMSIDTFKHEYITDGSSKITVQISNNGTILEKPVGRIIVKDSKDSVVFSEGYNADSIYSKTTAKMVYSLNDSILWPGQYTAYYEATFAGQTISRTFDFTVTEEENQRSLEDRQLAGSLQINNSFGDWLKAHMWVMYLFIFVVLLILGLLLFLIILLWKRRKEKDKKKPSPTSQHA
ncbi:MAG: hypothetical protein ACE3L7_32750 [Candidatus Pristimantibacillus sp.]